MTGRSSHRSTVPMQFHNSQVDVTVRKHQVGTIGNNRNYPRIKKQVENHTMGIEPRPSTRQGCA